MLGDPALDDRARSLLQPEAQREARRMRSYLQGRDHIGPLLTAAGGPSGPVTLPQAVRRVCDRFSDLPVHATLDLAESVVLDDEAADALDHALASVLLNVRDHSRAETIVIHADSGDEVHDAAPSTWVLTVHDDGVGFRSDPQRFGVGLREVVINQLRPHGVDVELSSTPGLGTTVTFTGRMAA